MLDKLFGRNRGDATDPAQAAAPTTRDPAQSIAELQHIVEDDRAWNSRFAGGYGKHLASMGYRRDDAEDILMETRIRAWKGLAGFRGNSSPTTYLWGIAENVRKTATKKEMRLDVDSYDAPTGADGDSSLLDRLADLSQLSPERIVVAENYAHRCRLAREEFRRRIPRLNSPRDEQILYILEDQELRDEHRGRIQFLISDRTGIPQHQVSVYTERAKKKGEKLLKEVAAEFDLEEDFVADVMASWDLKKAEV